MRDMNNDTERGTGRTTNLQHVYFKTIEVPAGAAVDRGGMMVMFDGMAFSAGPDVRAARGRIPSKQRAMVRQWYARRSNVRRRKRAGELALRRRRARMAEVG